MRMLLLALLSLMFFPAIHEVFAEDESQCCGSSKFIKVRLQGGGRHVGRVEICWRNNSMYPYQWHSVCTHGWGFRETMATCQQLNFSNSNVATLRCKEKNCFGEGSDIQVEVKCDDKLQLNHCEVNECPQSTHNAIILCGDTDREGLIETISPDDLQLHMPTDRPFSFSSDTTANKDSTIAVTATGNKDSTLIVVIALALVIVALSVALVLIAMAFPIVYQRKIKMVQQMCDSIITNAARGTEVDNQDSDYQHLHTNHAVTSAFSRITENKLQESCNENNYETLNVEETAFHTLEKDEQSDKREVLDANKHNEIFEPDSGEIEGLPGSQKMLENPQTAISGKHGEWKQAHQEMGNGGDD